MNSWFRQHAIVLVLVTLTLLSGIARFGVIAAPDQIAGDEVYFVNFARNYLTGGIYYDVHPPLGKLIIAIGLNVFGDNPFGWRAMSALFGTLLIPTLYWFGSTLFRRPGIGLALAALAAADGFIFVLSRVAAMDAMLLVFLLLGYTLVIRDSRSQKLSWRVFVLAGICFGLALSVKWFAAAWILATGVVFAFPDLIGGTGLAALRPHQRFGIWTGALLVPAVLAYGLVWLIHFAIFGVPAFELLRYFGIYNFRIFNYHTHIVDTSPYTSAWWGWPLLIRPWQYFHEVADGVTRLIIVLGTPVIWWAAVLAFVPTIKKYFKEYKELLFVGVMLLVHWLPFLFVQRPMFNYHFLMSWPFFMLPLAVLLYHWRRSRAGRIGIGIFGAAVIISVIFFWPLWNAVPLSEAALRTRAWLPGWR